MPIPIIPTKEEQEILERNRDFEALLATTPLTEDEVYEAEEAVKVILNLVSSIPEGIISSYADFVGSKDYLDFALKGAQSEEEKKKTAVGIEILTVACAHLNIFKLQIKHAIILAEGRDESSTDNVANTEGQSEKDFMDFMEV